MRITRTLAAALGGAALALGGCSDAGLDSGEDGLASSSPTPITIHIDASQHGRTIPEKYIGIAISRANIAGGIFTPLFSKTKNKHYDQLVNLFQEIGIKHMRMVCSEPSLEKPDPDPQADDDFFQFTKDAGLPLHSVIYSFHVYDEEPSQQSKYPNTDNVPAAKHIWSTQADREMVEHFALGNESDAYMDPKMDPFVHGYEPVTINGNYFPGFRLEWEKRYEDIRSALGGGAIPFAGPDTTSGSPLWSHPRAVSGTPFTMKFGQDEFESTNRIELATQHFYGGSDRDAPQWKPDNYRVGDTVRAADNVIYRCTNQVSSSDTTAPSKSTDWKPYPPLWKQGNDYQEHDLVQDTDANGRGLAWPYECTSAVTSSQTHPRFAVGHWTEDDKIGLLSSHQMSDMLSPTQHDKYEHAYENLAGHANWPKGLRYRMTEANAYAPGEDPSSRMFGLALWSLDFFHWWARHGAEGVDPFTRVAQYNSPIFRNPDGTFMAQPYAYGMLAFRLGSDGMTVPESALAFSDKPDWLSVYPVVNSNHLYVTFVNKSYRSVGSHEAVVTLEPAGFHAKSGRFVILESSPGKSGDAIASTAVLGGQEIPTSGHWKGQWKTAKVAPDGTVGPITVPATTAVVLELGN